MKLFEYSKVTKTNVFYQVCFALLISKNGVPYKILNAIEDVVDCWSLKKSSQVTTKQNFLSKWSSKLTREIIKILSHALIFGNCWVWFIVTEILLLCSCDSGKLCCEKKCSFRMHGIGSKSLTGGSSLPKIKMTFRAWRRQRKSSKWSPSNNKRREPRSFRAKQNFLLKHSLPRDR